MNSFLYSFQSYVMYCSFFYAKIKKVPFDKKLWLNLSQQTNHMNSSYLLKYGSKEKGSSLYKCSIILGFILSKKRFVILSSDKSSERNLFSFFDIKKPRRIEHLQSEEPFSSDPYFRNESLKLIRL